MKITIFSAVIKFAFLCILKPTKPTVTDFESLTMVRRRECNGYPPTT